MYSHHTATLLAASRQADLLREADSARLARVARGTRVPRQRRPVHTSLVGRLREQLGAAGASLVVTLG